MKAFGIFLIVVVCGALLIGGCVYQGYNAAIAKDEQVKTAWAQVDNQLQRRYDLIPNLVETVKGITKQEKDVFIKVAEARANYLNAPAGDVAAKTTAANQLESLIPQLRAQVLALREEYPQLKSNENFLKLQDSLEGTENRIAVERKNYNDVVRELNTMVRQIPGAIYARIAGVTEKPYFEVPEVAKQAPKVDFNDTGKQPAEAK